MSRYREKTFLDRQSFPYQEQHHDHYDDHWRGNEDRFSCNEYPPSRDNVIHRDGSTTYGPVDDLHVPFIEDAYPRGGQQHSNEFLNSALGGGDPNRRDSVFNRLGQDHITKRLGPEGSPPFMNHHHHPVSDPLPLFHSTESNHFDNVTQREPHSHWSMDRNEHHPRGLTFEPHPRELTFEPLEHRIPSPPPPPRSHHYSSNTNQHPHSLLEPHHPNYPSLRPQYNEHYDMDYRKPEPYGLFCEESPQPPLHREPLFQPRELVEQRFDHQSHRRSLSPILKPLFSDHFRERSPSLRSHTPDHNQSHLIQPWSPPPRASGVSHIFPLGSPPDRRRRSDPLQHRLLPLDHHESEIPTSSMRRGPSSHQAQRSNHSSKSRARSPIHSYKSSKDRSISENKSHKSSQSCTRRSSSRYQSPRSKRHCSPDRPGPKNGSSSRRDHESTVHSVSSSNNNLPHHHPTFGSIASSTQSQPLTSNSSRGAVSPVHYNHSDIPLTDGKDTKEQLDNVTLSTPTQNNEQETELYCNIENQQRLDNFTRWIQTAVSISDNTANKSHDESHDNSTVPTIHEEDCESTSSSLGLKIDLPDESVLEKDCNIKDKEEATVSNKHTEVVDTGHVVEETELTDHTNMKTCAMSEKTMRVEVDKKTSKEPGIVEETSHSTEELPIKVDGSKEKQVTIEADINTHEKTLTNSKQTTEDKTPDKGSNAHVIHGTKPLNDRPSEVDGSSVSMTTDDRRPETPESGEIVDSDEEREEGEIKDTSDEKEPEDIDDKSPTKDKQHDGSRRDNEGSRFVPRHYPSPSRNYNRSKDVNDRRRTPPRRRNYTKSPRYVPIEDRRKRRKSSPPIRIDDEKELLILRTAALETMIVKQATSSEPVPTTDSPEDKQDIDTKEDSQDVLQVVDMELVSSSETSLESSLSRDHTPEVSSVPPSQPLLSTVNNNNTVSSLSPVKPAKSCVKVVTNNNSTWKVSDFNIIISDGEEGDDESGPYSNEISDVIQLYRQVAEAKVSVTGRSLSSLKMELQECEEEIDEEKLKVDLLEQQLKVSQQKISKLKEQKVEVEKKIQIMNKLIEPKVPKITVDPPPSSNATPNNPSGIDTPRMSSPSSVPDILSTLSCPSSTLTSRSPSPLPDHILPIPNSDNKPISTAVQQPSSSVTVATGKQKQLINLVNARQSNLAQVKGLLSMIERNQRKRKLTPSVTQTVGKKIAKQSLASFVKGGKNVKQNPIITAKKAARPGVVKSNDKSKVSLLSSEQPADSAINAKKALLQSPSRQSKGKQKKKSPLENVLKQLKLKSLEEGKLKEWFDHMTSSNVSSDVTMPCPLCPLSPISIAINFFPHATSNNTNVSKSNESTSSLLRKALTKPDKTEPSLVKDQPSSSSFVAYDSSLLKFRSYRLSPLYRTLSKKPLSSLTHSNTINPDIIMCHHESQGQCKDKSCKAQHFADVAMTHDDIIGDITRYVPAEKISSIHEKLSKFRKLEKDQLQTMTAHIVFEELSHDDHVIIGNHWQQNEVQAKSSKPNDLKLSKRQNNLEPINDIFEDTLPNTKSDHKDNFRYFQTETNTTSETTPTSLIASAHNCTDDENAYGIIEQGLKSFPNNELLWMEYLQRAQRLKKLTDGHCDRAIASVPSYNIFKEIIKLSYNKSKWILAAIKHFLSIDDTDTTVSHIVLELLLSYCSLSIMLSGGFQKAVHFLLNFTPEIPEELVLKKLCTKDLVFLGLVHLHLLYTGKLPVAATGYHGDVIPFTITSTNNFLIPFTDNHILSQVIFDDIMGLFHRYLKSITDASSTVSVNVLNCLPLYINLFYFEISQGNSSTTTVSINRLLNAVPNIRELIVMKAFLDDSSTTLAKGTDPLVYYIQARKCLLKGDGINEAVKLLSDCVRGYYVIPDSEVDQHDPCMLYRKLLHYQVPYDAELPSIDDLCSIPSDCPSLCLNYCLLVELTTPVLCTEVYEASLHQGSSVWTQFIHFLVHRFTDNPTTRTAKELLDVCQRYSLTMKTSSPINTHLQDYTQLIDVLLKCVELPEDKVLLLKHVLVHDSPYWIFMFYQYSECLEQVRAVLAQYLTKFPHHLELWLIGISVEMRLGNYRQARWMFNKALQYIPYSSDLWTQFLLFELTGMVKQYSIPPLIQAILQKLNKYGKEFKSSVFISVQSFF